MFSKLMVVFALSIFSLPSQCSTNKQTQEPAEAKSSQIPSDFQISKNLDSIHFMSNNFKLRFKNNTPFFYEYFLENEKTEEWMELMDLNVVPVSVESDALTIAKNKAAQLGKDYSSPDYKLHQEISIFNDDKASEQFVVLDALIPNFIAASKKNNRDVFELNLFKFYKPKDKSYVVVLHYAKNFNTPILSTDPVKRKEEMKQFSTLMRESRIKALNALVASPNIVF